MNKLFTAVLCGWLCGCVTPAFAAFGETNIHLVTWRDGDFIRAELREVKPYWKGWFHILTSDNLTTWTTNDTLGALGDREVFSIHNIGGRGQLLAGEKKFVRAVWLGPPLELWRPPKAATVAVGQRVEFSAGAIGPGPLAYEWLKDWVRITNAPNSNVFVIESASFSDAGRYGVRVIAPVIPRHGGLYSLPVALTVRTNIVNTTE